MDVHRRRENVLAHLYLNANKVAVRRGQGQGPVNAEKEAPCLGSNSTTELIVHHIHKPRNEQIVLFLLPTSLTLKCKEADSMKKRTFANYITILRQETESLV